MAIIQRLFHDGAFLVASGTSSVLVSSIIYLGVLLLAWRLWRFTISPALRRDEPEELPYWIPYVGHAISFWQNADDLLSYGRKYFANTRRIFTITVAGQSLYIVTSPQDIKHVYKNTENLTFDGFVMDMYRGVGMSPNGMSKVFEEQASGDGLNTTKSSFKRHAVLGANVPHEQLQAGSTKLEEISKVFQACMEAQTVPSNIPIRALVEAPSVDGTHTVSLRQWAFGVLGGVTLKAFFGDALQRVAPDYLDTFHHFEESSWKLTYQYPRRFAQPVYDALDKTRDMMTRYYELPLEERADASHWTHTLSSLARKKGLSPADEAILGQMTFWGSEASNNKLAFWLLAYILHHPHLLSRIRAEIAPALSSGRLAFHFLNDACPLLNATLCEVLRLTATASSARPVVAPTTVGTAVLRPGATLLVPFRQLHYAPEFFPDPTGFRPERFLEDPRLEAAPFFRPFGGGTTYCPGRTIARRESLGFAAAVLLGYEVEVVGDRRFPRLDMRKPKLGVMDPVGDDDVLVKIRAREVKAG